MTHRIRAISCIVLATALTACGWEIGPRGGDASRAPADRVQVGAPAGPVTGGGLEPADETAAADPVADSITVRAVADDEPDVRPVAPPLDPVVGPLPDRVRPDSIGVLLERHKPRRIAGMDVEDYLLYLPPGLEDERGEWPLLLWLHGKSLRGTNLDRLKRYGPPAMIARGHDIPFVMVAPQLPPNGRWAQLDPVAALIDEIVATYPVDRDRIYLLGFSMGGGGAYRMAFDHGDAYAAMIGIAGHTPPPTEENVEAVASLPFLAIHGENDVRVPIRPARRMARALATAGAPLFEFRMAPGMNHSQLERLTRDENLFAWLLSHRRPRVPTGPPSTAR